MNGIISSYVLKSSDQNFVLVFLRNTQLRLEEQMTLDTKHAPPFTLGCIVQVFSQCAPPVQHKLLKHFPYDIAAACGSNVSVIIKLKFYNLSQVPPFCSFSAFVNYPRIPPQYTSYEASKLYTEICPKYDPNQDLPLDLYSRKDGFHSSISDASKEKAAKLPLYEKLIRSLEFHYAPRPKPCDCEKVKAKSKHPNKFLRLITRNLKLQVSMRKDAVLNANPFGKPFTLLNSSYELNLISFNYIPNV
ncbi:hypothetical protein TpMuguga_01g00254 [Theileria parva strain Muguga]|uniref:Uncharacterized protein n=1 Tax=Theileria parva TaxID=5875 RepID=Q4N960_THEPA|nr:uncharacterized protein TpMuguga_01g00254 [Theileria parva strain Muguga]EAN33498.1 hypothetical protein TpMuguga_01g00254 [Theileria parva strain Muguga]|eukprot:XP_765781.1 hypothetical protein [Theileria parva strain Muguga]